MKSKSFDKDRAAPTLELVDQQRIKMNEIQNIYEQVQYEFMVKKIDHDAQCNKSSHDFKGLIKCRKTYKDLKLKFNNDLNDKIFAHNEEYENCLKNTFNEYSSNSNKLTLENSYKKCFEDYYNKMCCTLKQHNTKEI